MTKRWSVIARWIVILVLSSLAVCSAESEKENPTPPQMKQTRYSFSYTPLYQFKADLDSGGDFDVHRHFLRFNAIRFINRQWAVGLGLGFDYEKWNFNNVRTLSGAAPWGEIFRPSISIPVFYSATPKWRFSLIPSVELAGASGAEADESVSYGAVLAGSYAFSPNFSLGLGAGLFNRLDQTEGFPFIVIDWKINDQFRLKNPFEAGPAGPAGLELVYTPVNKWEIGIGGAYRSYRFRLDDNSAFVDGIGEVNFVATFARIGYKLGRGFSINLAAGGLFDGQIEVMDKNGNDIGATDYDQTPFVGLVLSGGF